MERIEKVPAIRFKDFNDTWEHRKFGEVVEPFVDQVATPTGGYTRLGIRSHAKGTFHSYVRAGMELETAKMHRVAANNFIVNITFGWEHAVAITDEYDAGKLVSHRFPQFSFVEGMDPSFIKYAILDEKFRYHLWLSSPGGAGRNRVLKISKMLEYKFWITSQEEQKKIADFLVNLDNLITLHKSKLDKLKNLKKAMLDKMYPKEGSKVPEIRFAGFTDAWESNKLGDVTKSYSGGTPSVGNKEYYNGQIPFIRSAEINSDKTELFLSEIGLANSSAKMVNPGDILYALYGATSGEVGIAQIQGAINQAILVIKPYYGYDSEFIKQWLRGQKQNIIDKYLQGGQGNLSGALVKDLLVDFPNIEEQQYIGSFFRALDSLITLHQCKLEKLENIKKAFLEKMFV